jgi:hypothetical protein
MAVAGLLASSGFAMAETKSSLTLDPRVLTADDAAAPAPLMGLLGKAGLDDKSMMGLNIYGWVESGYTYNHRHGGGTAGKPIVPGPFNHEVGNHYMLNQLDLRFERQISDPTKFDVGGMVEVMYGTDAAATHSTGLSFNGNDPSTDGVADDRYRANLQFDLLQAYVDVSVPVGNGLVIRTGKFVALAGYETIDPRGNPFYSHSYAFNALPFTQTGVLGMYKVNDSLSVTAGISRGWDQTLEDSGPNGGKCYLDTLGQITYQINPQLKAVLNWIVGPENFNDTSHYRTVINPIVYYKVTDALTLGVEGLYIYDGGLNGDVASGGTTSHAYGDVWSIDAYAGYTVNDYVTVNGRLEKYHTSTTAIGGVTAPFGSSLNIYSATLGATIVPLPKDPLGKNLSVRPEIRYDFSDSAAHPPFAAQGRNFKDQLTFAADVIVKF